MPHVGYICDANGEKVSCAACELCARSGALPGCHQTAAVVRGMTAGVRGDDFGLSVTTLLNCPRRPRLMKASNYYLKPKESWWAYRGQLMHGLAELYTGEDIHTVVEKRYTMLIHIQPGPDDDDGKLIPISGQPDLVLVDRKHLIDYKTTKNVPGPVRQWWCPDTKQLIREASFSYRNKWMDCDRCGGKHLAKDIERIGEPRAYPHHVQQVSLYRLLLHANGLEVETAELVYLDMRQQLRVPVDLMPLEDAKAFVLERAKLHTQSGLPDVLRGPDEVWQCGYCPVRSECEAEFGRPVGKDLVQAEEADI